MWLALLLLSIFIVKEDSGAYPMSVGILSMQDYYNSAPSIGNLYLFQFWLHICLAWLKRHVI